MPDIVLASETTMQVVLLELTVPWEDRMEEAYERKRVNCEELAGECRSREWRTQCNPSDAGSKGFVGQSFIRALKMLGVKGLQNKKAIRDMTDAAEKASKWLWMNPGWVTWVRVSVVRPETPNEPRIQH